MELLAQLRSLIVGPLAGRQGIAALAGFAVALDRLLVVQVLALVGGSASVSRSGTGRALAPVGHLFVAVC